MVLELNHINFDLVPAMNTWWSGLRIPDKNGAWQDTDPHGFNRKLTARNADCGDLLKPAIRIIKRWNAANGYVFESYALEQWIVDRWHPTCSNLRDYVLAIYDNMESLRGPRVLKDRIDRARQRVSRIREFEAGQVTRAEREIAALIS
jgi:hypothetical protein